MNKTPRNKSSHVGLKLLAIALALLASAAAAGGKMQCAANGAQTTAATTSLLLVSASGNALSCAAQTGFEK